MSTQEDWLAAKKRRDWAAYTLATAYVSKAYILADDQADKFTAAESDMERISEELDKRNASL